MPTPQPQQTTWAHQTSVRPSLALTQRRTAQIGRARRWLLEACRSVAQALAHGGEGDAIGTEMVAHFWERAMPKPQPQRATWAHRMSVPPSVALTQLRTAQIGRAQRWLLKACGSVAQALAHGGEGGATGTEMAAHSWERAMPKPQPQQATWAHRMSVPPSLDLARPFTAQIGRAAEMALEGVPECCSTARARC